MTKYVAFNPQTRKHEEIDPELAELVPGETVIRMFYCRSAQKFVTVPGASLYVVNADGDLVLEA
jgi:hypothetical protein